MTGGAAGLTARKPACKRDRLRAASSQAYERPATARRDGAGYVENPRVTRSELSTLIGRRSDPARAGSETDSPPSADTRPEPSDHEPPIVLERYRLHRELGAGAFGTVWLARDERLERDVAVKIVPRARVVGGRLEREAHAAARLSHPGIVTLYEAGADRDGAYLVSELVRGSTLADLLDAGRLSDRRIVVIGIALCDALAHAHAENVVHRDVKPSNVLVPDRPSNPASVAKLTDFGVARIVGGDSLTRTGDVVGTAAYMAPEQAEGRDAGAPADLFSLALVLYEGLTGVNPVRTGTAAWRARRLGAHLPPLRRQRRELPRELGQAIDQALRPLPRERGTVPELRAALAAVVDRMSERPGVVAPRWPTGKPPEPTEDAELVEPPKRGAPPADPAPPVAADPSADPSTEPSAGPSAEPAPRPPSPRPARWPQRALAALATAALAGWLAAEVLPTSSPVPVIAVALAAALVVVALPAAGWLASVLVAALWLALAGWHGAALAIGLAGLVPPILLPRHATTWPLPAGAPALGAIGLAGAWPAIAGRARGVWTRAVLGAAGWVWLALGSALSGVNLYLGPPPGSPPPAQWTRSPDVAMQQVLEPLLRSGALAPALVWAAAAAILPWVVRGRTPALDFVVASAWASGLVAATYASLRAAGGSLGDATLHNAVLGGVLAFALALAPSVARTLRTGRDPARVP
jgi:serine/threonine protein kinase